VIGNATKLQASDSQRLKSLTAIPTQTSAAMISKSLCSLSIFTAAPLSAFYPSGDFAFVCRLMAAMLFDRNSGGQIPIDQGFKTRIAGWDAHSITP
jgi:hypothetical protein